MILVQEQKKRPMKEKNKFKIYSNKYDNLVYDKGSTLNQWGKTTYFINGFRTTG